MVDYVKLAYNAGKTLYGDNLIFNSTVVSVYTLKQFIDELIDEMCAIEVIGTIDDFQYAFTIDSEGIDCSGDYITDLRLQHNGKVMLYEPDYGVSIIEIDMTHDEMIEYIKQHVDY